MCDNVGNTFNPLFEKMYFIEQYADSVMDFTSKYNNISSISYAPENLCGPPERYPSYGDYPETFMLPLFNFVQRTYGNWWKISEGAQKNYRPQDEEGIVSEDYIVLGFESAVVPTSVVIYETYNPGSIVKIWGKATGGMWYLLYEAYPEKCPKKSRIFQPKLRQVNDVVNIIRLEFNQSLLDYHTSLDAVLLAGYVPKTELQLNLLKSGLSLLRCSEVRKTKNPNVLVVREEEDYINSLPYEVIMHIFEYLDLQSVSRCACVCERWYKASQESSIYQSLNLKKYWVKISNQSLRYFKYRCLQLKKLDLSWCGNNYAITEDIFQDFMKKCCKQLTHLSVCNCDFVQNVAIGEISNCSELIDLRLRNCFPSSWAFTFLSKLTKLQALDMYATGISDDNMVKILQANKDLKHLNLDFCENLKMDLITEVISIYNNKLITFSCWKTKGLTAEGVKNLAKCQQLRELDMGWCLLMSEPGDCLERIAQGCTDLRRLILSNWRGLNDHLLLPIIRSCKHLSQLDLLGIRNITADICECAIASLPKLSLLDVSFCDAVQKEKIEYLRNVYPHVTIQRSCESDEAVYYD